MNTWVSFSLLLLSILLAAKVSRGTVRLYFAAQLLATLALFLMRQSTHYPQVYMCAVLLMLEMTLFLLWDAGPVDWKLCSTWAVLMACSTVWGLEELSRNSWLILEGILLASLGLALLSKWRASREPVPVLAIGSLTLGMSIFDFGYLLREEIRATNGWLPSLMCTAAFLTVGVHGSAALRKSKRHHAA